MRYLEDLREGERLESGTHTFTRDEIVAFARQFDPQPFHLDEEAAKATPFGGLVASGWHTASVAMRLMVDRMVGELASFGSPGADELRWHIPVRPGDTVTLHLEIREVRPSRSRPDRGSVRVAYELTNQRGEVVLTMIGIGIVARRPPASAG